MKLTLFLICLLFAIDFSFANEDEMQQALGGEHLDYTHSVIHFI